jgi:hypothetical protein
MHELVGPPSLESDTNGEANRGLVRGPAQVKPGLDPPERGHGPWHLGSVS